MIVRFIYWIWSLIEKVFAIFLIGLAILLMFALGAVIVAGFSIVYKGLQTGFEGDIVKMFLLAIVGIFFIGGGVIGIQKILYFGL